jgi:hypothetical protein
MVIWRLRSFPVKDDEINIVAWEAVGLALAQKAAIAVPIARVGTVANRPYFCCGVLTDTQAAYPVPLRNEQAGCESQ